MSSSITGYGLRFEKPVGIAVARLICETLEQPLVRPGYECTIASDTRRYPIQGQPGRTMDWTCHLVLRNVAGHFVLCSHSAERSEWSQLFGVDPGKHGTTALSGWLKKRKAVPHDQA